MQAFLTLVRRELGMFFLSFTGYVVMAVVTVLLGLSFVEMVHALNGVATEQPLTEIFYNTTFFWQIVLMATPVITMRSFAQERASGTFETLMTAPVGDVTVVLAKYAGGLLFYLLMWLPLPGCLWVLHHFAGGAGAIDLRTLMVTLGGIGMIGSVYVSIGVFASSMTVSQVVAAMTSFAIGFGFWVASFFAFSTSNRTGAAGVFLGHISMIEHMQDFVRGVVDVRQVTFYVSLTWLFLFLACRAVESRRWRA